MTLSDTWDHWKLFHLLFKIANNNVDNDFFDKNDHKTKFTICYSVLKQKKINNPPLFLLLFILLFSLFTSCHSFLLCFLKCFLCSFVCVCVYVSMYVCMYVKKIFVSGLNGWANVLFHCWTIVNNLIRTFILIIIILLLLLFSSSSFFVIIQF